MDREKSHLKTENPENLPRDSTELFQELSVLKTEIRGLQNEVRGLLGEKAAAAKDNWLRLIRELLDTIPAEINNKRKDPETESRLLEKWQDGLTMLRNIKLQLEKEKEFIALARQLQKDSALAENGQKQIP